MSKQPVAPQVAADRVRKLLRIAQELELALELAREMPNDFLKRTMARHVIVRTENFIAHHQRLVSTASLSGRDELKQRAKYYSEQFDALGFAEARHKYAAHVQDLEYGFDVDFWQNVDNLGLTFFVDGARELYAALGDVGVPEFVEYEPLHETSDVALKESIRVFASENPLDARFRFGTDPLAWVRPGTGSMINAHPLHVRAGRLALIRLWMRWQLKLEPFLAHFPDSQRIVRARMVTDVVSFCDSLVSRTSAKHVEALDELLQASAASRTDRACAEGLVVITRFLECFAFDTRTEELRSPRNKYGAHLEIGDATSLVQLVQAFDALDFEEALSFFRVLERVFENTCRATLFLTSHIIGDEPLAGISSDRETDRGEPFERGRPDIVAEPARPAVLLDDDETLNRALDAWLVSSEEEARTVWWHALTSSKTVERIGIGKHSGGYVRIVELRRAHQVIRERLKHATHTEAIGIIKLIEACKRGDPQPLIFLVLEYARSSSRQLSKAELAAALGGIASWKDEEAREYVSKCAKNAENSCDRVLLARAVGKLFIQAEYFGRFNEKRIGVDFEKEVRSTADGLRSLERAIVFAAFASDLAWGDLSGAQEGGQFHGDYINCCQALLKECDALGGCEQCALAIERGDFVAVCLLLRGYTACDADAALCVWAAAKAVTCSREPAAWLNFALALGLAGEVIRARSLVAEAARQNPESTDVLVACVRAAAQILGGRPLVEELVANLNQNYTLTEAQKKVLEDCGS